MKTDNKNSVSQALIDLDELKKVYLEESKNTIKSLLAESIKDALNDSIEDEDKEDEEYTISDEDNTGASEDVNDEGEEKEDSENNEGEESFGDDEENQEGEEESEESDEDSDDSKFSEFDNYKNSDGAFDFSAAEGDEADEAIIKVYKLLKNSDQVIVKKDGDRAELKDNETGAEYVIDFGDGDVEKVEDGDEPTDEENDDEPIFEMVDSDLSKLDGEDDDENVEDPEEDDTLYRDDDDEVRMGMNENKNNRARKTVMKENKNRVLFEVDLGYTDNYQSKDPIEGLSAEEPAKDKKDWDAGVPKGTKKPWAGKGDSAPFDNKAKNDLNEEEDIAGLGDEMPDVDMAELDANLEEGGHVRGAAQKRSTTIKQSRQNEPEHGRNLHKKGKQVKGTALKESADYQTLLKSYNKILEGYKKLVNENKIIKEAATALKKNFEDAVLLNVNLGHFVKLVQENTTTKAERFDIINRLDGVKSINESKALYESISRELSSTKKPVVTLEEKQMTAAGTQQLNESKVYENPALAEIRNMMSRMDKKNFI